MRITKIIPLKKEKQANIKKIIIIIRARDLCSCAIFPKVLRTHLDLNQMAKIPFENAAQLEPHQPISKLKPSQPTSQTRSNQNHNLNKIQLAHISKKIPNTRETQFENHTKLKPKCPSS